MSLPWFRMYAEFATDAKVQSMPETMQRRLVMLFCLRCSDVTVTLCDEELAFQLRISEQELAETKALFMRKGFIDSEWNPKNWDKRQYASDSSAERTRRYREKIRDAAVTSRVTVRDALDTDTDTDTELLSVPNGTDVGASANRCPTAKIVDLYHLTLPMLPRIEKITNARQGYIRQRWLNDLQSLDEWRNYFLDVAASDFLTGKVNGHSDKPPFRADLEWLCKPGNFAKVMEGKYHRKANGSGH